MILFAYTRLGFTGEVLRRHIQSTASSHENSIRKKFHERPTDDLANKTTYICTYMDILNAN